MGGLTPAQLCGILCTVGWLASPRGNKPRESQTKATWLTELTERDRNKVSSQSNLLLPREHSMDSAFFKKKKRERGDEEEEWEEKEL